MNVLMLGLDPEAEALVAAAVPRVAGVSLARAERWSELPKGVSFHVLLVGSAAVEPAWGAFEAILRREVPCATLVAVPRPGSAVSGGWDDVLGDAERTADAVARALRFAVRLAEAQEQLARWALRDPLTDLLNRRGLERVLAAEANSRERGRGPLSVLLIDVDDFKQVNDALGMAGGDRVLREIAGVLTQCVRKGDAVARVGGDEFLVLLPGARTWEAVEVAERIRISVAAMTVDDHTVTVSLGVRRLASGAAHTLEELLEATQSGLKVSKSSGKNQVHIAASGTSARTSLSDAHSLPPNTPVLSFRDRVCAPPAGGAPTAVIRSPDVDPELGLQLAMQRAVQPAWDLHWMRAAGRAAPAVEVDLHLRLYPPTVAQTRVDELVGGSRVAPERLVIALDEQFLSGDLVGLPEAMARLRGRGVRFCLDVSDFGQACLESLVLLRPERVLVTSELWGASVRSRPRRASLLRFGRIVRSLGLELFADGVDPAGLALAAELGVAAVSRSDDPRDR